MEHSWNLQDAIEYCRSQNPQQNQQALVGLLREVQKENGGVIPGVSLDEISAGLKLKKTFLTAIIKRYPSLRTEEAPHRLEICGGERCALRGCRELRCFVEENYRVKNGGVSLKGGFSFQVTGCMKNCLNGPSIKWDGQLYSCVDKKTHCGIVKKNSNM